MPENNGATKSFYQVTGMSAEFRKFDSKMEEVIKKGIESGNVEAVTSAMNVQMKLWELRILLATAQQVTMVSESLKEIAAKFIA